MKAVVIFLAGIVVGALVMLMALGRWEFVPGPDSAVALLWKCDRLTGRCEFSMAGGEFRPLGWEAPAGGPKPFVEGFTPIK